MSYCASDWNECDCDCHRHAPGTVMHCMPCCYPCPKCGRNIKAGMHSLHVEGCEGTLNLSPEDLLTLNTWPEDI